MLTRRSVVLGACAAGVSSATRMAAASTQKSPQQVTKADVEAMMQSLSNWGRWGQTDELGTLNLITAKKRRQAARLVQDGVSVSMAHNAVKTNLDGGSPFEHEVTINNPQGVVHASI